MSSRPALALAAVATGLALTGCSAVSFVGGLVSGPMDAAATYQEMITESGLTRVGSAIWSAGHLDVVAFGDQASPEGTQLARQRGGGTTRTAERGRAYGVMPASALDVAGIDARARAAAPDCSRYLIRADVLPEGTVAVELECQDDDRRYVGFGSGAITPVVPEAPDGTAVRMLTAALPYLTADDLRDTPAGQALIAEGRGWTPKTERDRRALAILNDPTVPAGTRHILAKGIHLLHKLERMTGR